MEDATPCHISLLISSDIPIRCIKERTPLPYINVGAMNRVNPPLIFVSFNIFFPFFLIALK